MEIPIMRTIKELVSDCKKSDPNTQITEWFIRTLIKTGKLPVIKAGKKYLINVADFSNLMNSAQPITMNKNRIRQLK